MTTKRYRSSKLLRNIYVFSGFAHDWITDHGDHIQILLRRTGKTAICPHCGKRTILTGEFYERTIRDLDIGPKKCFVTFFENKINCGCGFRGHEKLDFVRLYARCTIRFEEFVYTLCPLMTLSDASDVADIDWKTAKDVDIHYAKEKLETLANIYPKRIGVDEVAYERGHKYLTIVRDLDLNKVIWVGIDRRQETLDAFFNELGFLKWCGIEVVVADMWDPYIASVAGHCPNADVVFDKFHISKLVNKALDEIRKEMFRDATKDERIDMKHKRFLILARGDNLSDEKRETLNELMSKNKALYKAYLLKEQIADILDEKSEGKALERMNKWFANVAESGMGQFEKCAETIRNHYYGIVNLFKHQVTNAGGEGFNNKIGVIKRRAYGFWDVDYFILKIYQACGVMKPVA